MIHTAAKRRTDNDTPFYPSEEVLSEATSSGRRRAVEQRECVVVMWPPALPERRKALKTWRRVAMQIAHHDGLSFRLMALIPDFINWKTGTLWPTNGTLAFEGGRCAERTIKRDIKLYRDAGLLKVEIGWRVSNAGKRVKTRTLRLALPRDLDDLVCIENMDRHGDNSGPYEIADLDTIHGDNSGPEDGDNSGPITFEGTFEEERFS